MNGIPHTQKKWIKNHVHVIWIRLHTQQCAHPIRLTLSVIFTNTVALHTTFTRFYFIYLPESNYRDPRINNKETCDCTETDGNCEIPLKNYQNTHLKQALSQQEKFAQSQLFHWEVDGTAYVCEIVRNYCQAYYFNAPGHKIQIIERSQINE